MKRMRATVRPGSRHIATALVIGTVTVGCVFVRSVAGCGAFAADDDAGVTPGADGSTLGPDGSVLSDGSTLGQDAAPLDGATPDGGHEASLGDASNDAADCTNKGVVGSGCLSDGMCCDSICVSSTCCVATGKSCVVGTTCPHCCSGKFDAGACSN